MPIENLKDFDIANPPESLLKEVNDSIPADTDVKDTPEPAKPPVQADEPDEAELEADDAPEPVKGEEPRKRTQAENLKIALKKEREARQERDKKLTEAETRLNMIREAWEAQQRQAQQPAQPQQQAEAEQAPDINTDPIGYFQWRDAQREREISELRQYHAQQAQMSQQQAQVSQLMQVYSTKAAEFSTKQQDFRDAYQHMVNFRLSQLKLMGYDDTTAGKILANDELGLVARATQNGQDPAEIIYNMAKASGYTPKQAQAIADQAVEAEQPAAPPSAVQQIEQANKKASAAKSLTDARGKSQSNMTLERLLELPIDEFEKLTKGNKWEELWGGGKKNALFN